MTSFMLKIIALISMSFDHFGTAYFKAFTLFNVLGRIAFPIFAFQIASGYRYTKNIKKYMIKLFCFAIISQIPFSLFLNKFYSRDYGLNVFFTLLLGLCSIYIFDYLKKYNNKSLNLIGIFIVFFIGILASMLSTDYGMFGVFTIFLFHIFYDKKLYMSISYIFLCFIYCYKYLFVTQYQLVPLFTMIPLLLILLYNEKQGPKLRYFLYIFYPIHLLALYFFF